MGSALGAPSRRGDAALAYCKIGGYDLESLGYVIAPEGWSWTESNPFSPDGFYEPGWSGFCVLNREDDQYVTGKVGDGPFCPRFGRCADHLENRLIDYLRYEQAHGRRVILSFPADVDVDRWVARAERCTPESHVVRPHDPPVVVHATTGGAWDRIRAMGLLVAGARSTSATQAPRDPNKSSALAHYLREEPPEYRDYVMFGEMDSTGPERVMASHQAHRFVSDDSAVYRPGIRLYLDNHRLIADGLGTRDGLHVIKVYRRLPLVPYLLAAIGVPGIDPENTVGAWTLRTFVDGADRCFRATRKVLKDSNS